MSGKAKRAVDGAVRAAIENFDGAPLARLIRSGALTAHEVEPLAARLFRSGYVFLRPDPIRPAWDDSVFGAALAADPTGGLAGLW